MKRVLRPIPILVLATAALAVAATTVQAKGNPNRGDADDGGYLEAKGVVDSGALPGGPTGVPGSSSGAGTTGILSLSGGDRYAALPARDGTTLARIDTARGKIVRSRFLNEPFTVPAVAVDGSTSGLSADGRTLVLTQPLVRFPQATTKLAVLDADSLGVRKMVRLRGTYSFDAISPDGGLLYLIQYTSPTDPTRYAVRAYDVRADRLLRQPVVDPDEAGRPMTGKPITRAMSPGGRWAYTLYQGGREGPFVHALDTSRHRAVCVDLDELALPSNLSGSQLSVTPDGRQLTIHRGPTELGLVDTQTFEASEPAAAVTTPDGGDSGGLPWLVIAIAAAASLAGAGAVSRFRSRRSEGLASGDV